MKSIRILAVAAGVALLAGCGGGNEAANNADNAAVENLDASADVNATDLNVGTDLNAADATAANAVDANAASAANAATNNAQ
jgi:hypothetical protein